MPLPQQSHHQWGEDKPCQICGLSQYARHARRTSACPGVRLLAYGEPWPDGMATKTQISRDHRRTLAHGQDPVVAYAISDAPYYRLLYDLAATVPKREASHAQRAALAKGRERQHTCKACGAIVAYRVQPWCLSCEEIAHRYSAGEWARKLLALPTAAWCILDTETTGLFDDGGEAIAIAVVAPDRQILFESQVRPLGPMHPRANAIHGIALDDLADAPTFAAIYPQLCDAVRDRRVVIYNASFDTAILANDCDTWQLPHLWRGWSRWNCAPMWPDFWVAAVFPGIARRADCAMLAYAEWVGEWSHYWRGYRWQQLPFGDHTARGDALGTLQLIEAMAASPALDAALAARPITSDCPS